jgi:hypothetical protein
LLQSILSNTRLNTILNKYADDSTKSILLNGNSNGDASKLNGQGVEETIDLDILATTTALKIHQDTPSKIAFELASMDPNNPTKNESLNQPTSSPTISTEISA